MNKPIPYSRQHITEEDIEAVVAVLNSDYLTTGPTVKAFETAFADYVGAKYAVAVSNGTAALHLAAIAMNVKPGTKVITTPLTFVATANCVRYCGGEVTFADIDPNTGLLDIQEVRKQLESSPKGTYSGIIPVDYAGYPINMEAFRNLADEFGLWLIEDASHAPGAWFTDSRGVQQKCGNGIYADLTTFSFHPTKHIACGEGGMITTNNVALYERLLSLRNHGIVRDPQKMKENHGGWYYEVHELGYNYRLSDIHAALGLSQLKRLDANIEKRHILAKIYDAAFRETAIKTFSALPNIHHAYHLYLVLTENRSEIYNSLKAQDIHAQVHYIPLPHLLPQANKLTTATLFYTNILTLPLFPTLDQAEAYKIASLISNIVKEKANHEQPLFTLKNSLSICS